MNRVQTRISVKGFSEAEARNGIPHLLAELGQRPWLLNCDAIWLADSLKLVVTVETEKDQLIHAQGVLDEVWDCVIACVEFSSPKGITFDIEDSRLIATQP